MARVNDRPAALSLCRNRRCRGRYRTLPARMTLRWRAPLPQDWRMKGEETNEMNHSWTKKKSNKFSQPTRGSEKPFGQGGQKLIRHTRDRHPWPGQTRRVWMHLHRSCSGQKINRRRRRRRRRRNEEEETKKKEEEDDDEDDDEKEEENNDGDDYDEKKRKKTRRGRMGRQEMEKERNHNEKRSRTVKTANRSNLLSLNISPVVLLLFIIKKITSREPRLARGLQLGERSGPRWCGCIRAQSPCPSA